MKRTRFRLVFYGLLFAVSSVPQIKEFYFRSGLRWQYILVFSFLASIFLTPLSIMIAKRFNILDFPESRKVHDDATPLLGGVSIFIAFAVALLVNGVFLPGMGVLLIGSTAIFCLGLLDDVKPLNPLLRFIAQIGIALFVILSGNIQLTFFSGLSWAPLVNIPITVLWIVGLTNAMNFFDGLDGLAGGLSIIIATFLGLIAFQTDQPALGWFAIALVGSCMGFLPYNFRVKKSALLFLGDAGSTFLGFTLAGLAVLGRWSNTSHFVSLTAPILIFGVLIFDMTFVSLSRIRNRQNESVFRMLAKPGKDHLHHRLMVMGFLPKEVVYIICTLSACFGVSALIIMEQDVVHALLGLAQALLILGIFVGLMMKGSRDIDSCR